MFSFKFIYLYDTLFCVPLDRLQTDIDTFNDYHLWTQFTHEIERSNRISFLDFEIIKLDNGKIVSNWYRKSTYSGRVLNFISNHPLQNKVAIIKNLVDRAVCLFHESFHSENSDFVRKIWFCNHYPQELIEEHIEIRILQIKSRKSGNLDTYTQCEICDENNTIILPYFGQISKTIQSMLKKFQIHTIFRIAFGMEEHKKNLGRKCNYHNVLSDHRKEYADHDFDWNNVEILHSENNKGKREFMEMLYTRGFSWNLPVLLIDVARDMYTFLWFGIYVIFFYGQ